MKPVTLWYRRLEKTRNLEFNHLEDGHNETGTPTSKTKEQANQWKNGEWDYVLAHLDEDNRVVES